MTFIDTHAHLYLSDFKDDIEQVFLKAVDAGIDKILMPALDRAHYFSMMSLVSAFPDTLIPMIGVHPSSIGEKFDEELDYIENELKKSTFCAIGETGIDLYWDTTYCKQQMEAFERQLHLANEFNLPVVIHQRNSFDEIFEVLEKPDFANITGVFHCFAGDISMAQRCIQHGFMLGIGGVVTYKNSLMAEVVKQIPLEHLLLETDSPYLPPVPYRGKRNEPSYIPVIAAKVAELKQVSIEEVAEITTMNAQKLFRIQ